jgi:hypothetical protein
MHGGGGSVGRGRCGMGSGEGGMNGGFNLTKQGMSMMKISAGHQLRYGGNENVFPPQAAHCLAM